MKWLRKGRALALVAALVAACLAFPLAAHAEDMTAEWGGTKDSTGSITIAGLQTGDIVIHYKVASIEKNGDSIETKAFNHVSQDVLDAYIAEPTDETVAALLTEAKKNVSTQSIIYDNNNGSDTHGGFTAGLWVYTIQSGDGSREYQTMVVPINVSEDGAKWEQHVTVQAKYANLSSPSLDIPVPKDGTSNTGVLAGESIQYEITFTIPNAYNDGSDIERWELDCKLGSGLKRVSDSITLIGPNGNELRNPPDVWMVVNNTGFNYGFYDSASYPDPGVYTITFEATVQSGATIENTWVKVTSESDKDYSLQKTLTHEFYVLEVEKRDADNNHLLLPGAVFALYADEACGIPVKDVNGNNVTITTGEDGVGQAAKNVLIKPGYSYYLKETAAPDGYNLNEGVLEYLVSKGEAATYAGKPYSQDFFDTKKTVFSLLPATGDAGGAVLLIAGIALVAGAVVLVRRPRQ